MSIKQNQPIKKHTNLYDWTLKAQPAPPHNCTKHGQILGIDLTTHTRNYPKPNLGIQHTEKKTVSKISEKLKRAAALQITKYQSSQQLNLNRRHARRNLNAPTTKKTEQIQPEQLILTSPRKQLPRWLPKSQPTRPQDLNSATYPCSSHLKPYESETSQH
jgi:hypothetical protein